jgi:hypothetical protein
MDIPIENILERIESLEFKVDQFFKYQSPKENNDFPAFLTMDGLAEYLFHKTGKRPAKPTIYGWINKKSIPNIKRDHSVLFERDKIDAWLISGRRYTNIEIMERADQRMVVANRRKRKSITRGQVQ